MYVKICLKLKVQESVLKVDKLWDCVARIDKLCHNRGKSAKSWESVPIVVQESVLRVEKVCILSRK